MLTHYVWNTFENVTVSICQIFKFSIKILIEQLITNISWNYYRGFFVYAYWWGLMIFLLPEISTPMFISVNLFFRDLIKSKSTESRPSAIFVVSKATKTMSTGMTLGFARPMKQWEHLLSPILYSSSMKEGKIQGLSN